MFRRRKRERVRPTVGGYLPGPLNPDEVGPPPRGPGAGMPYVVEKERSTDESPAKAESEESS